MIIELTKAIIAGIINILPNNDAGHKIRYIYYKKRIKYLGDNVRFGPYLQIRSHNKLSIGKNTAINQCCYINAYNFIDIGKNCNIGPNCVLSSANHGHAKKKHIMEQPPIKTKKMVIKNDVWLGANVTVTAGSIIGNGAIIGANSVVTKKIEPYTICAGVPARKIGVRK